MTEPATDTEICAFLRNLFKEAVDSADPANCLPAHLPNPPKGRTLLVAAGKAAASMARATEKAWPKDAPLSGIALTRYGHAVECERIITIEAAHPVPDDRGHNAAIELIKKVRMLGEDDLLLCLISGGGSALLALPAEGITLEDKKTVNKSLLMSGAPIGEMNTVRKHLSAIKGGRLAQAAAPARVVTLAISDVPHDDPSTIASGPTVPDPTTTRDAINLLDHYGISAPASVNKHLQGEAAETPKPEDALFSNSQFIMISRPADMLSAVLDIAEHQMQGVKSLGADIEGESRLVAQDHARLALQRDHRLILSGGETTVTVKSGGDSDKGGWNGKSGKGGRNCEYLLSLAIALDGAPGIYALAADTDGIDGSEDNAGAVITPDTLARA